MVMLDFGVIGVSYCSPPHTFGCDITITLFHGNQTGQMHGFCRLRIGKRHLAAGAFSLRQLTRFKQVDCKPEHLAKFRQGSYRHPRVCLIGHHSDQALTNHVFATKYGS